MTIFTFNILYFLFYSYLILIKLYLLILLLIILFYYSRQIILECLSYNMFNNYSILLVKIIFYICYIFILYIIKLNYVSVNIMPYISITI